jgi:sulfite exporter TauE/SafE/copper chaperone CopZ
MMDTEMPRRSAAAAPSLRTFAVRGMTCRSCDLLVERRLGAVAGVTEAHADFRTQSVALAFRETAPSTEALNDALRGTPYSLHDPSSSVPDVPREGARHWAQVIGMFALVLTAYTLLRNTGLVSFHASTDAAMGFGAIFVIGLIAATSSCLAVVGGLLLSVSAKWAEAYHPEQRWQKIWPLLLFNAGRLAGYFVFGGLVGLLGTALTLSSRMTGVLTLIIAVAMIMIGLNVLRILPKKYCTFPLPRRMRSWIAALSASHSAAAPLALGALTFFVPCGFTQSVQLLALGSGSFLLGGTIMLAFALGTLPALLGISLVSSLVEGKAARVFLLFSGCVVLLLGFLNLRSGLLLAGVDTDRFFRASAHVSSAQDPYVTVDAQGRQIITMYVTDRGYEPSDFTIDPYRPTWIFAIAQKPLQGCANYLLAPDFNKEVPIRQGKNWLGPLQNPQRDFVLTCSMGMLRANVHVRPS